MKLLLFEFEGLKDFDWMMFFVHHREVTAKYVLMTHSCSSAAEHYTLYRYNLHLQL